MGRRCECRFSLSAEGIAGEHVSTLVLDSRLHPFEGRAMARRAGPGLLPLWVTLAVLLGGSALLVLLT